MSLTKIVAPRQLGEVIVVVGVDHRALPCVHDVHAIALPLLDVIHQV